MFPKVRVEGPIWVDVQFSLGQNRMHEIVFLVREEKMFLFFLQLNKTLHTILDDCFLKGWGTRMVLYVLEGTANSG